MAPACTSSRLLNWDGPEQRIAPRAAVVGHLQRLLNTRLGSAPCNLDYGLHDTDKLLSLVPESLPRLCDLLCTTLARYEPRLRHCRVVPQATVAAGNMLFAVRGELTENGEAFEADVALREGGWVDVW